MSFNPNMMFLALITNMSISGNTLRIEETSSNTVAIPVNNDKTMVANEFSRYKLWAHFATFHTSNNRGNFAVRNMCHHFKENDGPIRVKSHTEYEVAYS